MFGESPTEIRCNNELNENDSVICIIPCYNEFERLPIKQFIQILETDTTIFFCFVNDGSTDLTFQVLNSLKESYPKRVSVINLQKNVGKAEAIRQGMLFTNQLIVPEFIAYLDADLSAPLSELKRLHTIILRERLLFVFGSRVAVYGSNITRNVIRHYLGRIFATGASIVLKMGIYDTQCGLKIFRQDLAKQLFEKPFISRWLFDIEIIARLKLMYNDSQMPYVMKEVPLIEWVEKGNSKLKIRDVLLIPLLFMKIKYHYASNDLSSER